MYPLVSQNRKCGCKYCETRVRLAGVKRRPSTRVSSTAAGERND